MGVSKRKPLTGSKTVKLVAGTALAIALTTVYAPPVVLATTNSSGNSTSTGSTSAGATSTTTPGTTSTNGSLASTTAANTPTISSEPLSQAVNVEGSANLYVAPSPSGGGTGNTTTATTSDVAMVAATSSSSSGTNSSTSSEETSSTTLQSAAVSGNQLTLTFSGVVAGSPSLSDFDVEYNGTTDAVTGTTISGNTVVLTLENVVSAGDNVTMGYSGSDLTGTDANPIADFTGYTVINNPLSTPQNLSISDAVLTWDAVTGATGYIVTVTEDGNSIISETINDRSVTSLNLIPFMDPGSMSAGNYNLTVMALGDGTTNSNSMPAPLLYSVAANLTPLGTPQNVSVSGTKLNWSQVSGALGYQVTVTDQSGTTVATDIDIDNSTSCDLSNLTLTPGTTYNLTVEALGDGTTCSDSSQSSKVPYTASSTSNQTGISGTVTGSNGPVSGAQVSATNGNGNVYGTNTDTSGHYSFSDLSQGSYTVTAVDGYLGGTLSNITVNDGLMTSGEDLTLSKVNGKITGTVTDGSNGQPVSGASVDVFDGNILVGFTFTGSDGTYSLYVPAGTYTVGATYTDTNGGTVSGTSPSISITVGNNSTENLTVTATGSSSSSDAATPQVSGPSSQTVSVGGTAKLAVTASTSDGGVLSYQWYKNSSNSTTAGTAITGATSDTYSAPTGTTGTTYYYCVITNTNNNDAGNTTASAASAVASVTVKALTNAATPKVSGPSSQTVSVGGIAKLAVTASTSDGGVLSYQWYKNSTNSTTGGIAITGATSDTYLAPTGTTGTIYYYCVITNTNKNDTGNTTASAASAVASVTVSEPTASLDASTPSPMITKPKNIIIDVTLPTGSSSSLQASDFSVISDETGATVTVDSANYDEKTGTYQLVATDTSTGSQNLVVTVPSIQYKSTPVAVTVTSLPQNSGSLQITPPLGATLNSQTSFDAFNVQSSTSDPVYYIVQVTDSSNNPVSSSVAAVSAQTQSDVLSNIGTGMYAIDMQNGTTTPSNENYNFGIQFNTAGTYNVTFALMDQKTNQVIGSATTSVQAAQGNTTFTVEDSSGKAVPSAEVAYETTVSPTPNSTFIVDQTALVGTSVYLPAGNSYSITGFYDPTTNQWIQLSPQQTFSVDAATGAEVTVKMPELGTLKGTVTYDGTTTPVGPGDVNLYPALADGTPDRTQQPIDVQVDASGNIDQQIPVGTYVATAEYLQSSSESGQEVRCTINQPVKITNGETTPVTWQTQQLGTLKGTVTLDGTTPAGPADLMLYPATADGAPDMTQQPIDVQVDASGNIDQQIPDGHYYATTEYIQSTDPSASGDSYSINQPVNITGSNTTSVKWQTQELSIFAPPSGTTGMQQWFSAQVASSLQLPDSVYYKLSVTSGGSPASNIKGEIWTTSGPDTFTITNGSAELLSANPISGQAAANPSFALTFAQTGSYIIQLQIVEASTGKVVASGSQVIAINQPNLSGTLFADDGTTPIPYASVILTGPNNQTQYIQTDENGKYAAYLTPGQWSINQIQDGSVDMNGPYSLPTQDQVTVQIGTSAQTANITDPELNVTGTAEYYDGTTPSPLANGTVQIQGGSNSYWAPTDAQGRFALALPSGSYTVTDEYGQSQSINVDTKFTVATDGTESPSPLTVAPAMPDFNLTVDGTTGQPLKMGQVGILSQSDYTTGNYQDATWYNVTENGTISGHLSAGTYVAFMEWDGQNSTPMNTSFTIQDTSKTLTTPTLGPVEPNLTGTVTQQGIPVSGATIQISPSGNTDSSQDIYLGTDGNGNFSSLQFTSTGAQDLLTSGTQYTVVGLWTSTGWIPMNQSFTAGKGETLKLQVPGADLTGTVSVQGHSINSGWIAFGPSGTIDTTGQQWIWAPIQSNDYSVTLPKGSYEVYAIQDASGDYYDETGRIQTPISITDLSTVQKDNVSFSNDFYGTLTTTGNVSVPNATLELSQNPNPTTNAAESQVQYISVDSSGTFSSELTPGTWYVLGVWDQDGNYTQLGTELTVSDTAPKPVNLSIAPNVIGTITWNGSAPTASKAWLILQNNSENSLVYGAPLDSANWSYSINLPAGTYEVLGVDVEDSSGDQSWIDLSNAGLQNITVSSSQSAPTSGSFTVDSATGTVTGLTDLPAGSTGYVVFQNNSDTSKYISVGFDTNGDLQANSLTKANWTPVAVEVGTTAYKVATFSDTSAWQITAGTAL